MGEFVSLVLVLQDQLLLIALDSSGSVLGIESHGVCRIVRCHCGTTRSHLGAREVSRGFGSARLHVLLAALTCELRVQGLATRIAVHLYEFVVLEILNRNKVGRH